MKCPTCGNQINNKELTRCPRCNNNLIIHKKCSDCGKCSLINRLKNKSKDKNSCN